MSPFLLLSLAAAPVDARFVLEVAGAPVAELRVTSDGARYVYDATHFLEEGPASHRVELTLSELPAPPEVLALLTVPALGCRDVFEENGRQLEQLCVKARHRGQVTGTLAGAPFVATYARGALQEIKVGSARWLAAPRPVTPPPESPFARGLAVPTGPLRLQPEVKGARWLTRAPRGLAQPGEAGRDRCLVAARRALAGHPERRLAVGLVVEAGRAFPHAWVVEGDVALEPSVEPGDEVLARRQYLELPAERSGRLFLELFDGALSLMPR